MLATKCKLIRIILTLTSFIIRLLKKSKSESLNKNFNNILLDYRFKKRKATNRKDISHYIRTITI